VRDGEAPGADLTRRLDRLRALRRFLDEAFRVPGTRVRFGWDPIIGLIPGAGDLMAALLASATVVQAHQMGVPRVVLLRMLLNLGIDLAIGMIPVVGDVADAFWKATTRNLALVERQASGGAVATSGDWAFVGLVVVAVLAMAAVPLAVLVWLAAALL
jgi:hypothetical protein